MLNRRKIDFVQFSNLAAVKEGKNVYQRYDDIVSMVVWPSGLIGTRGRVEK